MLIHRAFEVPATRRCALRNTHRRCAHWVPIWLLHQVSRWVYLKYHPVRGVGWSCEAHSVGLLNFKSSVNKHPTTVVWIGISMCPDSAVFRHLDQQFKFLPITARRLHTVLYRFGNVSVRSLSCTETPSAVAMFASLLAGTYADGPRWARVHWPTSCFD